MALLLLLVFLSGAYPLWLAGRANRDTSLAYALTWMHFAWLGWGAVFLVSVLGGQGPAVATVPYLPLCLTGCAAVAVLGARRPGAGAWNFVLLGLLAVLLLPLAERLVLRGQVLEPLHVAFLGGTLAAGILNYLPTRLGLPAVAIGAACCGEMAILAAPASLPLSSREVSNLTWPWLSAAPWLVFFAWRERPGCGLEVDSLWLAFRDRFGLFWALRTREQFNAAAANASWPLRLHWSGVRALPGAAAPDEKTLAEAATTLRALLKRFLAEEAHPPTQTAQSE